MIVTDDEGVGGASLGLRTRSPAETRRAGTALAALLAPGDVIALWGEFGAGKTTFVGGVALGLGVTRSVASPSFGLAHRYDEATPVLHHLDLYRVGGVAEAVAFGVEEFLGGEGVTFIEWPEVIRALLPPDRLDVRLESVTEDEEARALRFEATGGRGAALVALLAARLDTVGACSSP